MDSHPTYELLQELGRGDEAVVYRARDMALKRYVAVKELRPELRAEPRRLERFLEEARFLAGLRHENIVQVHGVDPDRGWIAMELMRGGLDTKLAEGPMSPEAVRGVLRQALGALAYLHGRNRLHGAVKPSNLLIDDEGRVKLADSAGVTPGGELRRPRGTPKYLAPELINPEFGPVGPGVDLYALGFSMLELLVGPNFERRFKGVGGGSGDPALGWLRWHGSAGETLPPARELAPGVPEDLGKVLDRLVTKPVAQRYSAAEVALADLADRPIPLLEPPAPREEVGGGSRRPSAARVEYLTEPPPKTPEPFAPQRSVGPRRPTPVAAGGAGPKPWSKAWINQKLEKPYVLYPLCALILLAVLGIGFWPFGGEEPGKGKEKPEVEVAEQPDEAGKDEKGSDGETRVAMTGETSPEKGSTAEAAEAKAPSEPVEPQPKPSPPPREETDREPPVVAKPAEPKAPAFPVGEARVFEGHTNWVGAVAFSPDGRYVLSGGDDRSLKVWDVWTGDLVDSLHGHADRILAVAYSRDGGRALSAGVDGFLVWDTATWKPVRESRPESFMWDEATRSKPTGAAISEDLSRLLVGRESGELTFIDLPGGRSWTQRGHAGAVTAVAVSKAGRRGLSGGGDGYVQFWDLEGAKAPQAGRYHGKWNSIVAVEFLNDSDEALACDQLGTVGRLGWIDGPRAPARGANSPPLEAAPGGPINSNAPPPAPPFDFKKSDAPPAPPSEMVPAPPPPDDLGPGVSLNYLGGSTGGDWTLDLAVSPDGRLALRPREAHIELWALPADGGEPRRIDVLRGHTDLVRSVAFSVDGKFAVSGADDRTVRVWRLPQAESPVPSGRSGASEN